jgi:hypothetical protein
VCLEQQSDEFKKSYSFNYGNRPSIDFDQWAKVDDKDFFTAPDGQAKQCGYIVYAEPRDVRAQLEQWVAFVNKSLPAMQDPVLFAAQAQRWFIAIHPFASGNGRVSRFVMDYIFESLGLPAPILADMNNDIYTTEQQWADEVGHGLIRAVRAGESCINRPNIRGCKVISDSANIITAEAELK